LLSALVLAGCGQIIEVPVESAGTEVSSSGVESSTTSDADETSGEGSTTDVDQATGADDTGSSTGGVPERVVFCVSGTMPFEGGSVDVPVDVMDVVDPSDVRVGVRVLRSVDDALTVTVTRGDESRTLLDVDACSSMVDLLFDDLAALEAEDACAATEQVETVVPADTLAPLLDQPNGSWNVGVSQSEASGSVESVCVSFGGADPG